METSLASMMARSKVQVKVQVRINPASSELRHGAAR
jgi:hypothetical protein